MLTFIFFSLAHVYANLIQKLKELINSSNLCIFQLFANNIEENISQQKLRNCRVAKKLMSHTFFVKINVEFLKENLLFLRNHSENQAPIFRDNQNYHTRSFNYSEVLFY